MHIHLINSQAIQSYSIVSYECSCAFLQRPLPQRLTSVASSHVNAIRSANHLHIHAAPSTLLVQLP
eukprot:17423-Eustigmatos_ZCMA.PRE.1